MREGMRRATRIPSSASSVRGRAQRAAVPLVIGIRVEREAFVAFHEPAAVYLQSKHVEFARGDLLPLDLLRNQRHRFLRWSRYTSIIRPERVKLDSIGAWCDFLRSGCFFRAR